jgi:hypothetical protein
MRKLKKWSLRIGGVFLCWQALAAIGFYAIKADIPLWEKVLYAELGVGVVIAALAALLSIFGLGIWMIAKSIDK